MKRKKKFCHPLYPSLWLLKNNFCNFSNRECFDSILNRFTLFTVSYLNDLHFYDQSFNSNSVSQKKLIKSLEKFQMLVTTSVNYFPWIAVHELLFFVVDGIDYVWTKNQFQTFCKYLIKMWKFFTKPKNSLLVQHYFNIKA